MRKFRFFIFCSAALLLLFSSSCASNEGEGASRDEALFPEGAIVVFASEDGYRLRVDRGDGSVRITEPGKSPRRCLYIPRHGEPRKLRRNVDPDFRRRVCGRA